MAIGIGSLATPLGAIAGIGLGPFFVSDSDIDNDSTVLDDVHIMLWIMAIATTASCAPIILFTKQRPKNFPSKSAVKKSEQFDFVKDLKLLLTNSNYLMLLFLFCMNFSVYSCLSAVVNSLITPYDYTSTDASILGAALVISGMTGATIFAIMIDKF